MRRWAVLLLAFGLLVAVSACGDDDSGDGADTDEAAAGSCEPGDLPLKEDGILTVATGEPVFEPWMVDDDPANGEGFEGALVAALAEEMGFSTDEVTFVRTGFDEAIAPGPKDYDFNIQQFGITEERDEVVDFSDGYYTVEQAIVADAGSEIADAESLADLQDAALGAAVASTSLDYIDEVIQPDEDAAVFNDNADAKSALDAGQVDGLVFDLPTAYYIVSAEIPDAEIVGILPTVGETEELGLLFEDGSELVPCVNEALAALEEDGTIAALQEEWLAAGGDIPTLSE
jgi:polar amino acid transport system substrate-binding protein